MARKIVPGLYRSWAKITRLHQVALHFRQTTSYALEHIYVSALVEAREFGRIRIDDTPCVPRSQKHLRISRSAFVYRGRPLYSHVKIQQLAA